MKLNYTVARIGALAGVTTDALPVIMVMIAMALVGMSSPMMIMIMTVIGISSARIASTSSPSDESSS